MNWRLKPSSIRFSRLEEPSTANTRVRDSAVFESRSGRNAAATDTPSAVRASASFRGGPSCLPCLSPFSHPLAATIAQTIVESGAAPALLGTTVLPRKAREGRSKQYHDGYPCQMASHCRYVRSSVRTRVGVGSERPPIRGRGRSLR